MGLDIYFTLSDSSEEHIEIGHFRKVNFLVKFFEDKGFDTLNQTPLKITREDAEELLSRCNEILENNSLAESLLPTMEGFFFGSTEYDELYFNDIADVRDYLLETLLPCFDYLESCEAIYFETWY